MPRNSKYVVAYDITEDKERKKVDDLLKNFGFRVQKSVFECRLTKRDQNRMLEGLEKLELKTGFVSVYKLQSNSKVKEIGVKKDYNFDDGAAFVI